jgi:hypothetical protein
MKQTSRIQSNQFNKTYKGNNNIKNSVVFFVGVLDTHKKQRQQEQKQLNPICLRKNTIDSKEKKSI